MKRYNWEQRIIPLANESFYRVGDRLIILPRVAVRSARDAAGNFLHGATTGDPVQAVPVSMLIVRFYPYSSYGETGYSKVICPHLSREWSQRVCHGERTGLYAFLPYKATFLDSDALDMLPEDSLRGLARRIGARPGIAPGAPEVECGPEPEGNVTHMCRAAVALESGVVGLWQLPVRDLDRAPKQAAAVVALFEYGLGPEEDVAALRSAFE
jgi:hypothetical protein